MATADDYNHVRAALASHGITRLFELREHGCGYEVDLGWANFAYNGAEGFWGEQNFGWMVQASHENSITFGGAWLVQAMRESLPKFEKFIYKGWDISKY